MPRVTDGARRVSARIASAAASALATAGAGARRATAAASNRGVGARRATAAASNRGVGARRAAAASNRGVGARRARSSLATAAARNRGVGARRASASRAAAAAGNRGVGARRASASRAAAASNRGVGARRASASRAAASNRGVGARRARASLATAAASDGGAHACRATAAVTNRGATRSSTDERQSSPASDGVLTEKMIQAQMAIFDSEDDEEPADEEVGAFIYLKVRRPIGFHSAGAKSHPVVAVNRLWQPSPTVFGAPEAENPEFEWKRFGRDWTDPKLRKLPFNEDGCGPTVAMNTPYKAFTQIWTRAIIEHIVKETNNYARFVIECRTRGYERFKNENPRPWSDTTVDEMCRFIGVLLAMGSVVKSMINKYWEDTESLSRTPGFRAAMSLERFLMLTRYIHFNSVDPDQPTPTSPIFNLQPLITHFNERFQLFYRPYQNLALGNSSAILNCWLSSKQSIVNKPVEVISHDVCDVKTGYIYRFELGAGEDPGNAGTPSSFRTAQALVLRLLEGLEDRGHTVWMSGYYNSPALARALRGKGFDCAGCLEMNRQYVPIDLEGTTSNEMVPGEVRGCTSEDVDLVAWRNKRRYAFISTYHGLAIKIISSAPMPSIAVEYNEIMDKVDDKDKVLSRYPVERTRQKFWYRKMFRRLLNVSVNNAYIIFSAQHNIDQSDFRVYLADELVKRHKTPPPS